MDRKPNYIRRLELPIREYETVSQYGRNLTLLAAKGALPKCYARNDVIEEIRIALRRRTKPNVLLVGVSGCGKTAIVEGLAQVLEEELYAKWLEAFNQERDCPLILSDVVSPELPIIVELSSGDLLAGTHYRGDFEERLENIIKELRGSDKNILLFIDEAHLLSTLGGTEGAVSAANILKPALARGEFCVINATTVDEFNEFLSKDKAFIRRFNRINVKPIPKPERPDCAIRIVEEYSTFFNIPVDSTVDRDFLAQILNGPLSKELFPCAFVDVVDQVFAEASYRKREQVTKEVMQKVLYKHSGCLVL